MTPIVQDGDLVIIESGAILEYLLAKYAKGSPLRPLEDSPDFPRYLQFMHYAEGTAMAGIGMEWILRRIVADERVATDHRPAWIVRAILVAAMECIAVKEDRVAGFHLAVNKLQFVQHFTDARQIGPGLLPFGIASALAQAAA